MVIIMESIFTQISMHRTSLANHSFCQLLKDKDANKTSLRFIPTMTFFVLGFRDILESMKIDNPQSDVDKTLNIHCEEDSEHWRWFIEDLNKLGMQTQYWGGNVSAILHHIWSPDHYIVRDLVYRVIHHVHSSRSTNEKLIIVECLEAAFAAFIENLNPLTKKIGMYQKLRYFGEHHYEKEADHAAGSWIDEDKTVSVNHYINIADIRNKHMQGVVDDIFSGFHDMFTCWQNAMVNDMPERAIA